MKVCDAADRKPSFKFKNHTFNLGGSCPKGCSAADGVVECYAGCAFGLGPPPRDIWQAQLPESVDLSRGLWGLHLLADPAQPWHTMQTLARWPDRVVGAGVRDLVAVLGPLLSHHAFLQMTSVRRSDARLLEAFSALHSGTRG